MTASTDAPTIRHRVVYSGRVQGVCFRATARELARRGNVVGFVRNQADGSVELEAEGPPGSVRAFLKTVQQEYTGFIRHTDEAELPAAHAEQSFDIRY